MLGNYSARLVIILGLFVSSAVLTSFNNNLEMFSNDKTGTDSNVGLPLTQLGSPIVGINPAHPKAQTIQYYNIFLPLVASKHKQPLFGVQIYFDITNNHPGLQSMTNLPTVWVRKPVGWAKIESVDTTPDHYNWAMYDNQFLNAWSNNLKIIGTIGQNPRWAAQYSGGPVYSDQMDSFLEFVSALVERYDGDGVRDAPGSPVVEYWEFYNEPDNSWAYFADRGWGYWGNRGAEYAELMAEVYPVVKSANPSAIVLMGGIAHDYFSDTGGPFDRAFVDDFLAAGGGTYIDFFNFHYYPVFAPNWDPYGHDLIGKTNFLKAKLAIYGIGSKPIAITEIGRSTDPNASSGVSEEEQSRYVLRAFSRAIAADIKIMTWFTLNDLDAQNITGLTDANFIPKPSYLVYQTMTTQLADVSYQRALTGSELGSSQAEGYVYQRGLETVYIVWTNDDSPAQMTIQASHVTRVDKFGASTTIFDTTDGVADGLVIVNYDGSPVYLILA
jgi:hypothetical protein